MKEEAEFFDLKSVLDEQRTGYSGSVTNRLDNHDVAVSNISLFKVFAAIVPVLVAVVILVTIILMVRTKRIVQLVALCSIVQDTNASPIYNTKNTDYIQFASDILVLCILVLIVTYCSYLVFKHYEFIRRLVQTASLD